MKINKDILKNILLSTLTVILSVAVVATIVKAASDLTVPEGALSSGSPLASMHTLEDIYHKLTNTALDPAHTLNPSADPAGTMHTVEDIYNASNDANLVAGNIKSGATIFGVPGTMYPSQPLKTGQTTCYDLSGNPISCASTGQDGEFQKGVARSYIDNGNGTISDNNTGLMWQKCAAGQSGGSDCSGSTSFMPFASAIITCHTTFAGLGGYSDWRVPTKAELYSIVDDSVAGVPIDHTYFPNTTSNNYWSSTVNVNIPANIWVVVFNSGGSYFDGSHNRNSTFSLRCVR